MRLPPGKATELLKELPSAMATLAEEALAEEYSKHRPANTSEVSSEAAAAQAAAAGDS